MPTNGHPPRSAIRELIANEAFSRTALLSKMLDGPNRDIDHECGYPSEIEAKQYRAMYDREGVAARVVNIYPRGCWQLEPCIYEVEDAAEETEFEKAIKEVGKSLRGTSWFEPQEEQGNPLFHYLQKVDELSGIGRFGVLLLGLDDGKDLSEPVEGFIESADKAASSGAPRRKLIYLRALDESLVTIDKTDTDRNSPRYGQPTLYTVTLSDPSNSGLPAAANSTTTAKVHWHRIIHVADNCGTSEVLGTPRMQPVWNRLMDLRKLLGGSAEMFWKGAFPGYSFEIDPTVAAATGLDLNNEEVKAALREEAANFFHSLERIMATVAVSVKSHAPQIADPTPHIRVQVEGLCITIDVPLRIFLGSERGELASSQDVNDWFDSLDFRNQSYTTPRIIVPTIDRLICVRVLPIPEQYYVSWPERKAPSQQERAEFAKAVVETLAKYVGGSVDQVLPLVNVFTTLLGMSQEEADAIIEAVEERAAELEAEQEAEDLAKAEAMAEMQAQGQGQPGQEPSPMPPNGQQPPNPNNRPNGQGGSRQGQFSSQDR